MCYACEQYAEQSREIRENRLIHDVMQKRITALEQLVAALQHVIAVRDEHDALRAKLAAEANERWRQERDAEDADGGSTY